VTQGGSGPAGTAAGAGGDPGRGWLAAAGGAGAAGGSASTAGGAGVVSVTGGAVSGGAVSGGTVSSVPGMSSSRWRRVVVGSEAAVVSGAAVCSGCAVVSTVPSPGGVCATAAEDHTPSASRPAVAITSPPLVVRRIVSLPTPVPRRNAMIIAGRHEPTAVGSDHPCRQEREWPAHGLWARHITRAGW
jgi:hypothetical protein